tara:strand:- start:9803 stop:11050 length:1248 start_codon:yes stop_codon:yes gene_type:complete
LNYSKSIFVFGIRSLVLLSKFFFTIFLAKKLSIDNFGLWVLIFAIVSYASILLGMEGYNVSLRNYIKTSPNYNIEILSRPWQLYYLFYALIFFVTLLSFILFKEKISVIFFIISSIIILEHCTLEIHRYGIFKDEQISANIILLLKSFGWMFPYIYIYWDVNEVSINSVLLSWLAGCIVCLIYCLYIYLHVFLSAFKKKFNFLTFSDIKRYGILIFPFLVLSLSIRTPIILDRYLLEIFGERIDLAIYGYYMSYGNGVQALFDAVIIAPLIPKLLKNFPESSLNTKKNTIYITLISAVVFWIACISFIYFLLPYINIYTEKEIFTDHISIFILISFAQMIFSLSLIPQYYLYSINLDMSLISGALIYLVLSCISLSFLIPAYGAYGAGFGLMIGALTTLFYRLYQLITSKDKIST